jgi:hypothetical protein
VGCVLKVVSDANSVSYLTLNSVSENKDNGGFTEQSFSSGKFVKEKFCNAGHYFPLGQRYVCGIEFPDDETYPVWRRVRLPPPQSLRVVRGDEEGTQSQMRR